MLENMILRFYANFWSSCSLNAAVMKSKEQNNKYYKILRYFKTYTFQTTFADNIICNALKSIFSSSCLRLLDVIDKQSEEKPINWTDCYCCQRVYFLTVKLCCVGDLNTVLEHNKTRTPLTFEYFELVSQLFGTCPLPLRWTSWANDRYFVSLSTSSINRVGC